MTNSTKNVRETGKILMKDGVKQTIVYTNAHATPMHNRTGHVILKGQKLTVKETAQGQWETI